MEDEAYRGYVPQVCNCGVIVIWLWLSPEWRLSSIFLLMDIYGISFVLLLQAFYHCTVIHCYLAHRRSIDAQFKGRTLFYAMCNEPCVASLVALLAF